MGEEIYVIWFCELCGFLIECGDARLCFVSFSIEWCAGGRGMCHLVLWFSIGCCGSEYVSMCFVVFDWMACRKNHMSLGSEGL